MLGDCKAHFFADDKTSWAVGMLNYCKVFMEVESIYSVDKLQRVQQSTGPENCWMRGNRLENA